MRLEAVAEDLWVARAPMRFYGVELGTRMTVIRIGEELMLHSSIPPDAGLVAEVTALGTVRWVVAPCKFHHLFVGPWLEACPTAIAYGAPGLAEKRPDLKFAGMLDEVDPWPGEIERIATRSFSMNNEVVFLHRKTRTLILTDLAFNYPRGTKFFTAVAMASLCAYPGFKVSLLERVGMDRAVAREELARILAWDFDRVILAHGEIAETNGKELLRAAYAWLG